MAVQLWRLNCSFQAATLFNLDGCAVHKKRHMQHNQITNNFLSRIRALPLLPVHTQCQLTKQNSRLSRREMPISNFSALRWQILRPNATGRTVARPCDQNLRSRDHATVVLGGVKMCSQNGGGRWGPVALFATILSPRNPQNALATRLFHLHTSKRTCTISHTGSLLSPER